MADTRIADHLLRLGRALEAGDDTAVVLRRVVDAAAGEITGADYAGVTLTDRHGALTPVSSDELVARVDALQYETGEGPCLDAAADQPVVRCDDLGREARWPRFAPRAVEVGVHSMLSFHLSVTTGTTGALNLYARAASAFGADAERIGAPLAAHAALAMVATHKVTNLRAALDSRDLIGQAKGILMERYRIDGERAFELLLRVSQTGNVKLRDVAEHLTATGELTTPPRPRSARRR